MRKQLFTWMMIVLMVPTLACGLFGGGEESASSAVSLGEDTEESAEPTQPPVVEDVEEISEEPTPEPAEPESAPFAGSIGLDQFDSYRTNITLQFTGATGEASGDQTTDQRQDIVLEVVKSAQIWHQAIQIQAEGAINTDVETESYYVDGVTYTQTFDNWIAQDGLLGRSQFSNPRLYTALPETALCNTEPENVNGISTIHCTFTEQDQVANSLEGAERIQGDVWIAEEGNYVVKYELAAQNLALKGLFTGGFEQFETYNLSYELLDTNNVSIELPAEAQGTEPIANPDTADSSGLAAPDGAEVFVDSFAGMNYFSTDDLSSIADFHLETLPAAGWQAVPEESYRDDGYALLIFENEEGVLRVFIQQDLGEEGYFVSATLPFDQPGLGSGGDTGDSTGGSTAGAADVDLPLLDDAEDVFSAGGITTYFTPSDMTTVVDFYREELTVAGWTEDTTSSYVDDATAILTFNNNGTTLLISATAGDDGRISVNLLPGQE